MLTQDGVTRFRDNVLGNKYGSANVVIKGNGLGGNDCELFYKDSVFNFIGTNQLATYTRDICEFTLVHRFTNDTLIVYGVHLKANTTSGDNSGNIERRAAEIDTLRKRTKQLKPTSNYIVAGDFNILDSYEPAFAKLLDSTTPGYFYDPLQAYGNWNNNSSFAFTHSYSPTKLNTRFDMILLSQAVIDGGIDFTANSFKIFGNDGNHFNKSIMDGTNYWFDNNNYEVGLAATQASDHLPVYADFDFGVNTSGVSHNSGIQNTFKLEQNYPNPFNPETTILYYLAKADYVTLKVYNLLGKEVAVLTNKFQPAGAHTVKFSVNNFSLASGVYFYILKSGNFTTIKKMIILK
jgi:hypothetical protein